MHVKKQAGHVTLKKKLCTHAVLCMISTGQNPIKATSFDKWKRFFKTFDASIAVFYLIN